MLFRSVKKYRGKVPLFIEENIEEKLNQIFDSEIKLKSGGYLVINPTEALVSIDINSGSSIKVKMLKALLLIQTLRPQKKLLGKLRSEIYLD